MPSQVTVPSMGESVTEAVLIKWHKSDGESVRLDEPVAELETDKANVDVPSTAAGVITRTVKEGAKVLIGQVIATVDPSGTATASPAKAAVPKAAPPADKPAEKSAAPSKASLTPQERLSPAARRVAEENKVDPATVAGSGPGGRILKEDVQARLDAAGSPAPGIARSSTPVPASAPVTSTSTTDGAIRRVPMSKIRKKTAENLVRSQQTTATLTTFNEVDLSAVMELRTKYKEKFEKTHGVGLGFMSFFAKAVTHALMEFERVNGSIDGDDLIYHDYVHLGIAVSTDRGLAVPVLRNAHQMSFAKLESEIKRLAQATRDGKLQLSELSGGTFTITNGGVFGSLLATPIVNPPQSAILGMHTIKDRPVVVNGQIVARPMMYVALSYDHRIIDGKESVGFLVRVKEMLEDPARLLLEV